MDDEELFDALIGLAVQGERWRVGNRILQGIPLNQRDSMIRDCGVGDPIEHMESGRVRLLRIVNKRYPDRKREFLQKLDEILFNEGTDKP